MAQSQDQGTKNQGRGRRQGGQPPGPRVHHPMSSDDVRVVPFHGGAEPSPTEPPPDQAAIKPPPEGGGWGWFPPYGWGYFPMLASEQPPIPGGPSVVVFEDRFRAGSLDQGNWWTRYIYSGPDGPGTLDYLNDEAQRYRETGSHVFGDGLALTALPNDGGFYPSGMLRSKGLFDIASGQAFYFECRARVPRGQGVWPAFWLSADAREPGDVSTVFWPPEIDIMEIVNNGVEDTTAMLGARCQVHDWTRNPQQYQIKAAAEGFNFDFSVWYAPFDFADDFHRFGLLYQRPNYTIYCDGGMVVSGVYDWCWDDGSAAPPAHVLVNLAIGGNWAGRHGIDDSAFPQGLEVDYVRVYCETGVELPRNTIGKDYAVT